MHVVVETPSWKLDELLNTLMKNVMRSTGCRTTRTWPAIANEDDDVVDAGCAEDDATSVVVAYKDVDDGDETWI